MREKLTKKDVEKIEQEIEHRKLVVRKEAIEAVKEARAQGDLSENFEYYAAKRHKNQNESRIRYLENMLKTATIVSDKSSSDEVGMDDIVEVYFEEDDEIEKYKLVTSIRGNSMENRISIDSPIGMALKGHKIGDRVEVKVNDNYSYFLEIRSIVKPIQRKRKSEILKVSELFQTRSRTSLMMLFREVCNSEGTESLHVLYKNPA